VRASEHLRLHEPWRAQPEYISVKSNSDGAPRITVRSLGGGLASIDLPPDEIVALGRALLTRQPVQLDERESPTAVK
jgi:hypothetical protein